MTKTKQIPVIDLGDGMTFTLHSFTTKEGQVILGYLFKPGYKKPATFFSLDKIAKLNNGIVGNAEQFQSLYQQGQDAISNGWTVEFGEVKAEMPDEEPTESAKPSDGLVEFNTKTKTQKSQSETKPSSAFEEMNNFEFN